MQRQRDYCTYSRWKMTRSIKPRLFVILPIAMWLLSYLHLSFILKRDCASFALSGGALFLPHPLERGGVVKCGDVSVLKRITEYRRIRQAVLYFEGWRGLGTTWLPRWQTGKHWRFDLPLWIPILAGLLYCISRDMLCHMVHRCKRCGYDLSGQIETRCPECGTAY